MDAKMFQSLKENCRYFLHGHGPQKPSQYFSEMAEYTEGSEVADVYGQGEALQNFDRELAELFGQERAVFFQSGTMAQLVALRIWSERAENPKVAFHPTCHLELHEHHAYRHLHRLEAELVGDSDRLIQLEDLAAIKWVPSAVLLELPQREIGGQLPSWEDLKSQVTYLHDQNIRVHMDGARIWECAPYYQKSYAEIAGLFDSIYISFYKGIGAIAGAALLGPESFCREARVWNRRHGGNLYTAFPLYLSARANMKKRVPRFAEYKAKTEDLCRELAIYPRVRINPSEPQVNMFHMYIEERLSVLKAKVLRASQETKVWGLDRLTETTDSNVCKLEWYVGDGALATPMETTRDFLQRVLT